MMARRVMMRCLLDVLTPLSLVTKGWGSFEMRVVILIGGRVSLRDRESVYIKGCSEDFMYLFLFFLC